MKKILITGGAGFIGSNLSLALLKKGYEITVLDNLSPQIHGESPEFESPLYQSILGNVRFIKGSVTSKNKWSEALKDQNAIIHLAAETGTGQSMYEIQRYIDVNIGGTGLLLDMLANTANKVNKVIIASSRAIYGEGKCKCPTHGVVYPEERSEIDLSVGDFSCKCPICKMDVSMIPTTEDSKIHPTSVYGITKQSQEQLVMTVCKSLGISATALRYQNVYGPGQSLSNPYTGIMSIFSTRIKNGKGINIFEDGFESRDFVYIDDVISATILALENTLSDGQSYNVGTGINTDVLAIAKKLCVNYGSEVPIDITGCYRLGDIRHNVADISKIRSELGFEPEWSIEKGFKQFTKWVNMQAVQEDKYEASIREMKEKGLYK